MSRPDPRTLIDRALQAPDDGVSGRLAPLVDLDGVQFVRPPVDLPDLCRVAVADGAACVIAPAGQVGVAAASLHGRGVAVSALVNHPDGSDDLGRVIEEAEAAVAEGASELDVLIPVQAVLEGDTAVVTDMVEMLRGALPDTVLKIVLRTDRLAEPERITAAARAAVMAGCDMLVATDAGLDERAGLEASAVLLAICAEAAGKVGFKIEGAREGLVAAYFHLIDEQADSVWVEPTRVRFAIRP
ncbi:hypothetical protein [Marinivivus vitaminiproducens]|uniref:hypothetical protein n=1 Tax=Marinivivus vitaminiproducens TaxID=3035935 RepID=UPI00279831C5|nr:hypothetical protein P4R82_12225 [Geminicoccaceae bacterium SCSIO 64248]